MLDYFSIVAHLESGLANGSHMVRFFHDFRHHFLIINGLCDAADTVFGTTKTGFTVLVQYVVRLGDNPITSGSSHPY